MRGPEVFAGYEGGADPNAFFAGWFRTGDLGYVDRDGFLFIVGRAKELVNRRRLQGVAGRGGCGPHCSIPTSWTRSPSRCPHATLGEDVAAAVVVRAAAGATAQSLRDFAFAKLAVFMVPSQILLVPELPRSSAGKANRTELATLLRPRLRPPFVSPREPPRGDRGRLFLRRCSVSTAPEHSTISSSRAAIRCAVRSSSAG